MSLLGGQIMIPAYLSLPTPVVIAGALLALVGMIALFILYVSLDPW